MSSFALISLPPIPPQSAFRGVTGPAATSDSVRRALDLSAQSRSVFGTPSLNSSDDREGFLQLLAALLKQGIVGTETRNVDGRPVERFITTSIGDESLRDRPYYLGPDTGTYFDRVA